MRFGTYHLMTRPQGATIQQIVQETLAEAGAGGAVLDPGDFGERKALLEAEQEGAALLLCEGGQGLQ